MASHLWNLGLRRAEATQVQPGKLAVASTVRNCKMRFITMSVEICRYCILHRYSISMCQLCVYNLCISLYICIYLCIWLGSVYVLSKYVCIRICKGQTKVRKNKDWWKQRWQHGFVASISNIASVALHIHHCSCTRAPSAPCSLAMFSLDFGFTLESIGVRHGAEVVLTSGLAISIADI